MSTAKQLVTSMVIGSLAATAACRAQPAPSTQPAQPPQYPAATLDNGKVRLLVYLPDGEKGFYRGLRFDRSGLVAEAHYQGHVFFGPFRPTHNPLGHDDIQGTAEEFDIDGPADYAQTPVGGWFTKIGVGQLQRTSDRPYGFWENYPLRAGLQWNVKRPKDAIEFTAAAQPLDGRAYELRKRVALTDNGFVIERELKNTGTRQLTTQHYGHNFIIIDHQTVGPDYTLTVPFELAGPTPLDQRPVVNLAGHELHLNRPLAADESAWCLLQGYKKVEDHRLAVMHVPSSTGVQIIGDQPLTKLVLYATPTAFCPEPFVHIELAPGQSHHWSSRYELIAP